MQLKDISKFGGKEEFEARLVKLTSHLRSVGEALYHRTNIGRGFHIYSAIAEATARQIDILMRLFEEPIEITANICRTIFEINIALRYCLISQHNLDEYTSQAGTDEISIYESIKKVADKDSDSTNLLILDEHIKQIRDKMQKHGLSLEPKRRRILDKAEEVGLKNEYNALYGIYSKYVHASAWFVLRKREDIDLPVFRMMMQLHAQLYATDTLQRLEKLRDKTEHN